MKKSLLFLSLAALAVSCGENRPKEESRVQILSTNVPYCESTLMHNGKMIVPSFGAVSEFNSLNTEGKGYMVEFTDTVARILFANDGNLSSPKGTLVKDGHLFIADVAKIVIYDLAAPAEAPQVILFPEGELMLNDFALRDNLLYTTVTTTGNIYSLDITDPTAVDPATLQFYTNVVGANGILIDGSTMYIASFPPDLITTEENVIYRIENMDEPAITKLITRGGRYDGLALSPDGTKLYFSGWGEKGEIGWIDLQTADIQFIDLGIELAGPGRFVFHEGKLYIPDMPNSRIVIYTL